MKWFRTTPRLFLEPELEAWHLAAWGWLLANFGGIESLRQRPLVTPTRTFFTPTETTGHDRIAHVFAEVKQHAGLGDWHCALVAQPAQPGLRVGELVALQRQTHAPAGTFGLDGNEPLITYDPALESDPLKLVAVLAHELAHLRMLACAGPLPGASRTMNARPTSLQWCWVLACLAAIVRSDLNGIRIRFHKAGARLALVILKSGNGRLRWPCF